MKWSAKDFAAPAVRSQAACRRHFNKRALPVARQAIKDLHGFTERTGDGDRNPASLGRGNHGFNGSFATVGNRQLNVLRIGVNFPKTLFYRGLTSSALRLSL